MSVAKALDRLRDAVAGCELAAYADATANLVLRVSAQTPWPRERLDALCATGAVQIGVPRHPDVATALAACGYQFSDEVIVVRHSQSMIFATNRANDADLICCVLAPDAPTETAARAASDTARRVAGAA